MTAPSSSRAATASATGMAGRGHERWWLPWRTSVRGAERPSVGGATHCRHSGIAKVNYASHLLGTAGRNATTGDEAHDRAIDDKHHAPARDVPAEGRSGRASPSRRRCSISWRRQQRGQHQRGRRASRRSSQHAPPALAHTVRSRRRGSVARTSPASRSPTRATSPTTSWRCARTLATFFSDPTEIALNIALATHVDREADNAHIQNWTALSDRSHATLRTRRRTRRCASRTPTRWSCSTC